ncbi:hypothetical protein [Dokdonella sp.]|uniref:hypothetical protein n=1 Tax=Dokdonella sp. TaxID=2291710 RepID=UPI003783533E
MRHRRHHAGKRVARLSRRREWIVHGIGGVLWLSGVAWIVLHYFLRRAGEFGEQPHPLEIWSLRLHGGAAFAALWLFGLLWPIHVIPAWRARRRASGIVVAGVFIMLIASGWLLYYGSGDDTRAAVALVHWIIGLALLAPYLWHTLRGRDGG